jgi:hypothetical protein
MKRVAERRYSKTSKPFTTPITLPDGTIDESFYNAPSSAGFTLAPLATLFNPRTDGQAEYFGSGGKTPAVAAATPDRIYVQRDSSLRVVSLFSYATVAGTGEDWSAYVYKGGVDYLIATVGAATNGRWFVNQDMGLSFAAGDYCQIKLVHPTWATPPTGVSIGGYLYFES